MKPTNIDNYQSLSSAELTEMVEELQNVAKTLSKHEEAIVQTSTVYRIGKAEILTFETATNAIYLLLNVNSMIDEISTEIHKRKS